MIREVRLMDGTGMTEQGRGHLAPECWQCLCQGRIEHETREWSEKQFFQYRERLSQSVAIS